MKLQRLHALGPLKAVRHRWRAVVLSGLLCGLLAFSLVPSVGRADDDQDRARQALLAGKVLPLRVVLDKVESQYPGDPVDIEFEEDDGLYLYEIKLLQSAGNIIKLKVDAQSGEIIRVKGRSIERREAN
ncbi:PepSY domain-containing protein [Pusillimonas minor]|uniref:PepSY domain-containing protein n=1 Tax=Pusillimonas minor TaxID=2697024 RepID=A0A842HL22_9BURK|nr:PepSY domain-containing protein [Pusillimonas minor]MBC2768943.1 PepSY domain-containing protein [Pusillimonas minor]